MRRAGLLAVAVVLAVETAGAALVTKTRLNPTGRDLQMPVTVKEGATSLGDLTIVVDADDRVSVDREMLLALLKPRLTPEAHAALAARAGGASLISLDALSDIEDVRLVFEPDEMEVRLTTTSRSGQGGEVPIRSTRSPPRGASPALVSGFLNVTSIASQRYGRRAGTGVSFEFAGATRVAGVVLEGEAALDGPFDHMLCPESARCSYAHASGLKRMGTRLVADMPDWKARTIVGDQSYWGHAWQRGFEFAGVGIRHDGRTFGFNDRADAGAWAPLSLDGDAEVDVAVNGASVQRLKLRAGQYRLTDLPVGLGANDVTLTITGSDGTSRTIRLKALAHDQLMAPGRAAWGFGAGLGSVLRDKERVYDPNVKLGAGYANIGVADGLTAQVHASGDGTSVMGGVGLLHLTPWGLFTGGVVASMTGGTALAPGGDFGWELIAGAPGARLVARAEAQVRSTAFWAPGESLVGANGVVVPVFVPRMRLAASLSQELLVDDKPLLLSLTGRYASPNLETALAGAVSGSDRWGATLAATRPFSPMLGATLWVGYGNERLLSLLTPLDSRPELSFGFRVTIAPSATTMASLETNSLTRSTLGYASARGGDGDARWSSSVSGQHSPYGTSYAGSLTLNNRYTDTTVAHSGVGVGSDLLAGDQQQTTVRSTSALVFTDTAWGLGPSIRDGFVLFRPHASLANTGMVIGDPERPIAKGRAPLIPIPSYTSVRLPLDVTDAPPGYSLGSGVFETFAPYKAGYIVTVGSEQALTVTGQLLDGKGQPVALVAGSARDETGETTLAFFTNGEGRFGIDGMGEGAWTIAVPGREERWLLTITRNAEALVDLGPVYPLGSQQMEFEYAQARPLPASPHGPSAWHVDIARAE